MKGYGLLQPGDRQRALTDAEIKSVDFIVLRDRWSYLDKGFDRLYQQMDRCKRLKKPYTVSVMTGDDCAPDQPWYIKRQPWNLSNLKRYTDLQAKLSTELKGRGYLDSVCGVWITGPTVPSQEMHLNGADKFSGFSRDKMIGAWQQACQIVKEYYPQQTAVLSISGQSSVTPYLDRVINYAQNMFGKNVVFQHNSLGTQTNTNATHHKKLIQLYNQGYDVGAEMVQPGHTAGIKKFPQAKYIVLYPGDQNKTLPKLK